MTTRNIIDFAADDNAKEMREALYASIYDRVTNAIEAKKQEIAHTLMGVAVEESKDEDSKEDKADDKEDKEEGESKETEHEEDEDEKEDKAMIKKMVKKDALK